MYLSDPIVNREIRAALIEVIETHCHQVWAQDLAACVPQLAALLEGYHDHPMEDQLDTIRRIVLERCQLDEGGDAPSHDNAMLGEVALMLAQQMERLRCKGVHRGQWSSDLAPPPMCG